MGLDALATAAAGWLTVALLMALLWIVQLRTGNAGTVDAGWTFGVAGLALLAALTLGGWWLRRLLVAGMFAAWGLRLGLYLVRDRIAGRPEDGRYADLRRRWGAHANSRFFWFFQAQALAALFFALPAFLASANPEPGLHPIEAVGLALWVTAFAGEALADRQLERFKADPSHRGRTCRAGLWRYSRHPNYFFEWLQWVAYALFALASPGGVLAVACPTAMLYLLFRVTGIPATEAQALRTRGDDYRRYQQTTSAFVPWRPR